MMEQKKVVVFSSEYCHWCTKAKEFFKEHKVEFEEVDTDEPGNRKRVLEAVKATGQSGIPIIKIGEDWVVGFDEAEIRRLLPL